MKIALFFLTISLATHPLENSGSSNSSSSCSPRLKESPRKELQLMQITRTPLYSKDKTRLKRETFSGIFGNGNSMEMSCIFKKSKPSKYKGITIKNGQKAKADPFSAEQDFKTLKIAYLQNNPSL